MSKVLSYTQDQFTILNDRKFGIPAIVLLMSLLIDICTFLISTFFCIFDDFWCDIFYFKSLSLDRIVNCGIIHVMVCLEFGKVGFSG